MIRLIKKFADEIIYMILNYFVCNIPIEFVRRYIYKLFGMKMGKGTKILMKTVVVHPWKIRLGDYVFINERCFLDGRGGLVIGSNTTVAIYSKIITGEHNIYSGEFDYLERKISIGNNCAIFAGAIILPGVEIENKVVVVAGSVVMRGQYIENCVYGGNPAVYVKQRNLANEYLQNKWKPLFR